MKGDLRTLIEQADRIALDADYFTARAYQELIEALDAAEGDPDFEPWLGWTDLTPVYPRRPIYRDGSLVKLTPFETNHAQDDREFDPADEGEPEDHLV